jgi:hypothetical protein
MIPTVKTWFKNFFKNREREQKQIILESYHKVFQGHHAEIVIMDLMKYASIDQVAYGKGASSEDLAFNEGAKAVIIHILDILHTDPIEVLKTVEGAGTIFKEIKTNE